MRMKKYEITDIAHPDNPNFYETVAHYFGCKLISGQLCE